MSCFRACLAYRLSTVGSVSVRSSRIYFTIYLHLPPFVIYPILLLYPDITPKKLFLSNDIHLLLMIFFN